MVEAGASETGRAASAHRIMLALFLGALALRPQITAVGPLLPEIRNDFALSFTTAGLLTTIPLVRMGVFAIPAARLYGSTGARAAVALALLLVAVAGILRALSGAAF